MSVAPAIEVISREEKSVLILRGHLSLADSVALREAAVTFSTARARGGQPDSRASSLGVCDVSELESTDVGVLQILAALEAEFARHSRTLVVEGVSEALRSHWEAAGWCGFAHA